jgi:hypothetical protein
MTLRFCILLALSPVLLSGQTLPEPFLAQTERLRKLGASVRIEQQHPKPVEVWIDFDRPVSNDQLKQVAGLEPLTALRLLGKGFGDAGLANLKNLPRLWLLIVSSDKITDRGAEAVSRLKSLTKLDFMYATLTARGIDHLRRLPKLEQLYLHSARLDEAALKPIAQMTKLRNLSLPKPISDKAVEELRRALPGCRIQQF